jgi:hypothetical protein
LEVRKRMRSSIETPSRGLVSSWNDGGVRARSTNAGGQNTQYRVLQTLVGMKGCTRIQAETARKHSCPNEGQ